MSISWKFHEYPSICYFLMLTNADPENVKTNLSSKGFNAPSYKFWDCSLCNSRPIQKISWKSTHPFYCNVANRQAAAPRWETVKQSSQSWNSLANYFLGCVQYIMKISWKSVHPFSIIWLTNTDPENENRSWIQGINHNIPKISHILPCLISDFCWRFHENPFIRVPVMFLTESGCPWTK